MPIRVKCSNQRMLWMGALLSVRPTMEESTDWACPDTKGIHLACCHTGSSSILHSITILYWHCSPLALTNMGDELPSYIHIQVCFFSNYPAHNYCCLGTYAWIQWFKKTRTCQASLFSNCLVNNLHLCHWIPLYHKGLQGYWNKTQYFPH